jgi:uncharacterized protein
MAQNLIERTQSMYAAFGRGDIPAVIEALDPKITWVNPGPSDISYFGTHRGREAVLTKIFAFLGSTLKIDVFQPHKFLADGDTVVVLIHVEAVAQPTGRRLVQEACHVWTFTDGSPTHFHDFQDNAAIVAALRP